MLAVLDRLDPEIAGVTLDTGNLAMRLDDPLAAAERLAPFVVATHVKDMVARLQPDGGSAGRPGRSAPGILPIPDLLAAVLRAGPTSTLSIELHPRIYDLPIYDPRWLAFFPGLRPESLAAVVRLAAECERRYAEGSLARPEAVEAIPWASRDLDWLASSLGYLRSVVPTLIETTFDPAATADGLLPVSGGAVPMTVRRPASRRIVSLDQFRGYTVAGMLLVNFIGGYRGGPRGAQAPQHVLQLRRHDHAPVLLRRGVRLSARRSSAALRTEGYWPRPPRRRAATQPRADPRRLRASIISTARSSSTGRS